MRTITPQRMAMEFGALGRYTTSSARYTVVVLTPLLLNFGERLAHVGRCLSGCSGPYMVHPKPEPNMKMILYEMDIYLYREMSWIILYIVYIYIFLWEHRT